MFRNFKDVRCLKTFKMLNTFKMFESLKTFQNFVSRGGGWVSKEVAALRAWRLQDLNDGFLQCALTRLVHRLQWGVSLRTAPPRHSGCLACFRLILDYDFQISMDRTTVVLGSTGGQTHWLYLVREGQIFRQLKVEVAIICYHSFLATFKIAMSLSPEGLFMSNLGCLWTADARTKEEVALQWSCSPNITRNVAPPFKVIRSLPPYR